MRVISGKYRSRPLAPLRGLDLRPTLDRLRETLFNVLTAGNPAALEGTVWLDLYAGTGAIGIEALSRGAQMVYFVESVPEAAALLQKNLQLLGIAAGASLIQQAVARALPNLQSVRADYIFLDPPYLMKEEYQRTLHLLGESSLLKPGSIVIAEHEKRFDLAEEYAALHQYRVLKQGDAALSFYRSL